MMLIEDSTGKVHTIPAESGRTVGQVIWLSGKVSPPALCSGLGRCGACRLLFLEGMPEPCAAERDILGEEAVAVGWRLGCKHLSASGMRVLLPPAPLPRVRRAPASGAEVCGPFRLAVDLGTTSIQWRVVAGEGQTVMSGQTLNPQMGAGSDVVSRLAEAQTKEGRRRLRGLVLALLKQLVADSGLEIEDLCLAGNTAMTSILMDKDIAGLAAAPYTCPEAGGRCVVLADLPPAWLPPQPAPFVGGDVSAGMAFVLHTQKPTFPFLLADLGTNGELVLALDEEHALVTSVPLGPALEGIGLTHGGLAGTGSVSGYAFGPFGLLPSVIGRVAPERICGTGYLSLLDILLRTGVLDVTGQLHESDSPLAKRLLHGIEYSQTGWRWPLAGNLVLHAADVEEVLKVKAAFSLALAHLLDAAGVESHALTKVYVAGALGEHISGTVLESLGFLPSGMGARAVAAGNTSLEGAALLAVKPALRDSLVAWSRRCTKIDCVDQPDFVQRYAQHMRFSWDVATKGRM